MEDGGSIEASEDLRKAQVAPLLLGEEVGNEDLIVTHERGPEHGLEPWVDPLHPSHLPTLGNNWGNNGKIGNGTWHLLIIIIENWHGPATTEQRESL